MLPPQDSLVKYDNPLLISSTRDKKGGGGGGGGGKGGDNKPQLTQTEDILNSILPPREWTEDGQLWAQYVSSTPATRLDVINLQERLDQHLQQRQARETGICPVREELYAQTFDELIRFSGRRFLFLFLFFCFFEPFGVSALISRLFVCLVVCLFGWVILLIKDLVVMAACAFFLISFGAGNRARNIYLARARRNDILFFCLFILFAFFGGSFVWVLPVTKGFFVIAVAWCCSGCYCIIILCVFVCTVGLLFPFNQFLICFFFRLFPLLFRAFFFFFFLLLNTFPSLACTI
jgi:hypothetical protein